MMKIDIINFRAVIKVVLHTGSGNDEVESEVGVRFYFFIVRTFAEKDSERRRFLTFVVDLFDFLDDFEESGAARETVRFKRGRNGETNCLLGARLIGDNEVGGQWVESAFVTFNGSVKRFEVNRGKSFLHDIYYIIIKDMKEKDIALEGASMTNAEDVIEKDLSRFSDQKEMEWRLEARERLSPLIDFLSDKMGQNLQDQYGMQDNLKLFQKLKFWLFGTHKDVLYEGMERFGFEVKQLEREMITATILSVTTERDNIDFIMEVMIRSGAVRDLGVDGKDFVLETNNELIIFSKADEYFDYQNKTVEELLRKEDLRGGCHEAAEKLFESNSEYEIMTAICRKNLVENYYHSVVLIPGEKVVDVTENLVIGKEDFDRLYNVQETVILDHEEYEKIKNETEDLDESGTLYVPLRAAVYEWRKNGRI